MSRATMVLAQWIHVALGATWMGTVVYTRVILFPALRVLDDDQAQRLRDELVSGRSRRFTNWVAGGTITMGFVRGWQVEVYGRLDTPYGVTFVAAAVLGVAMLLFVTGVIEATHTRRRLYVAGFPVIFTLMILMRFGL